MDKVAKYVKAETDYVDINIFSRKNGTFEHDKKSSLSIGKSNIDTEGEYISVIGVIPHNSYIKLDRQNAQKLIAFLKTIK